jgi:ferredoxin
MTMTGELKLRVNPVACTGHGACAELLPELISPDEWGYPVIAGGPVPVALERAARRAVTACPALALLLSRSAPADVRGNSEAPHTADAGAPTMHRG